MKKCPKCGSQKFKTIVNIAERWNVDGNGRYLSLAESCVEVTRFPNEKDIWECNECHYKTVGENFNIKE